MTTITNIGEYLERCLHLTRQSKNQLWFRGHRSAGYSLLPGLYRNPVPIADGRGNPVPPTFVGHSSGIVFSYPNFAAMLIEFKRLAAPHLTAMARRPADDFEWIFLMQHYGVRTRLLDWSTDPLIALYFAVKGENSSDAMVHLLDPVGCNKETVGVPSVISLNEGDWNHYVEPGESGSDFPICVAPAHIDPRVIAQSSMFTLHGFYMKCLDDYYPVQQHLNNIRIDGDAVTSIRSDLEALGYHGARVFPGLDTVAQWVTQVGEQRFAS